MSILQNLEFNHINILFILGIALFGGTFGGRLFQWIKIPQVVGYIAIGIIIGESGFDLINAKTIQTLSPINSFALGLIGFTMGNELRLSTFKKLGKQFIYILFFEALGAFLFILILAFFGAQLMFPIKIAIGYALIFAPIGAATAAAGTTDVLNEYKAKGILTTTILGIVALDDILALLLFAITSSIAASILGNANTSLIANILEPTYEIIGSIIIGSISGYLLSKLLQKHNQDDKVLAYTLGAVLFILGLSVVLKIDMIMTSMIMGTILANMVSKTSKSVFKLIENFAPPIYILFFVFVGAKFNISGMSKPIIVFLIIFLIGRTSGKMVGAFLGAKLSNANANVRKFLPLSLFSQSGVAVGLSIIASQKFQGEIGNTILAVVTTSTFIVQIIGPQFLKTAIHKADEVNKDITIDDLKKELKIKDVTKKIQTINENADFKTILNIFSEIETIFLPVTDKDNKVIGIITVDSIKELLTSDSLINFLLAADIMIDPEITININESVDSFYNITQKTDNDVAAVIDDQNNYAGLVDISTTNRILSQKLLRIQAESQI